MTEKWLVYLRLIILNIIFATLLKKAILFCMKKIFAIVCCLFFSFLVQATQFGSFINPKSAALGNSITALTDNLYSSSNQAVFGLSDFPALNMEYENHFCVSELSLVNAGFSLPTRWFNVGFSCSFFGFSEYNESSFGLQFSRKLSPYFSLGAEVDYVSVLFSPQECGSAFLPQIGFLVFPTKNLTIGFHSYNFTLSSISTVYQHESLPSVFSLGLQYQIDQSLLVITEVSKNLVENASFSAGVEYVVVKELSLRAGFFAKETILPSFGLGLHVGNFSFDLGMQYHSTLGVNSSAGVIYSFLHKK